MSSGGNGIYPSILLMQIHFAFSLIIILGLSLLMIFPGVVLMRRGFWPRRMGSQPHCRACDYLLIGIDSEKCPECGAPLTKPNIVHGQQQRRPGVGWSGAILLLFGLAIMGSLAAVGFANVYWYHFKPTFLVMRDLNSASLNTSIDAIDELSRRDRVGSLSSNYEQRLIATGLAQQVTGGQGLLTAKLVEFLESQYLAGHLTDAQKTQWGQQSLILSFRVRPIVVLGNFVTFQIAENSRVSGQGFYVKMLDDGGEIDIDGKKVLGSGSGSSAMSGLGSGGSSGNSVLCRDLGKHQLTVVTHVELHQGNFGTNNIIYQEARKLTADFEVVAQAPPEDFKLINDPKLAGPIQASIQPSQFSLGALDRVRLQAKLKLTSVPANIAFDVIVRFAGHDYNIGSITCKRGAGTEWSIAGSVVGASAITQPTTVDLILRSSEKVGRQTVDQHDAWDGELVYPNVAVSIDQSR
jgi:hypothetical protein